MARFDREEFDEYKPRNEGRSRAAQAEAASTAAQGRGTRRAARATAAAGPSPANIQKLVEVEARRRVREIENERKRSKSLAKNGRIYTRFDPAEDVISNQKEKVSRGLWSDGSGTLKTFFQSTVQSGSTGAYYYDVHNTVSTSADSKVQFAIAYGHKDGSGSLGTNEDTATKAIYSQYRNLVLSPGDTQFTFKAAAGSKNSDDIYAMTIQRARIREKLDPGNWELNLSGSGGLAVLRLVDDSGATTDSSVNAAGRVFNVCSGSIADGVFASGSAEQYFGLVYPDLGIVVLDPDALDKSCSLGTQRASNTDNDNAQKFFNVLSGSGVTNSGAFGFVARNEEEVTSTHFFVRVKNSEYNFSNNPTYTSGSFGDFYNVDFFKDPKSYITTVGLYSDANELLAVAKLSKPLFKNFNREALVKVKLDY
jgi:hypothetical protein